MNKPKDPCKVCPFIRQCIADDEDAKRWCFIRILTLEAWDRTEEAQRRKKRTEESAAQVMADFFDALGGSL